MKMNEMTKDEAREQLESFKKKIALLDETTEAIDMAIKALESKEGTNKCANDSCSFAMEIEDMCGDCKYAISTPNKSNFCPNCGAEMVGDEE